MWKAVKNRSRRCSESATPSISVPRLAASFDEIIQFLPVVLKVFKTYVPGYHAVNCALGEKASAIGNLVRKALDSG